METHYPWHRSSHLFRKFKIQNSILGFTQKEKQQVRVAANLGYAEVIRVIGEIKSSRKESDLNPATLIPSL